MIVLADFGSYQVVILMGSIACPIDCNITETSENHYSFVGFIR